MYKRATMNIVTEVMLYPTKSIVRRWNIRAAGRAATDATKPQVCKIILLTNGLFVPEIWKKLGMG